MAGQRHHAIIRLVWESTEPLDYRWTSTPPTQRCLGSGVYTAGGEIARRLCGVPDSDDVDAKSAMKLDVSMDVSMDVSILGNLDI
ncbi:hypothetical protein GMORB2_7275 [Geosmithia morbida]|uniref:Uncharacterized protein n=1 Tax=Geosmithia morbida TaxID=1094350 RepID=A0A9P5D029_9HYPO|nr:uncharacterized protein GMORB2_7275 [Geosmithia morbida]KAF4122283.1 hypothetical protein GMORB2_7275 [Geosmithia morbida]